MSAVANWTTAEKLDRMRQGWVEKGRKLIPEEGRVLIELHHAEKKVVTFRSLEA